MSTLQARLDLIRTEFEGVAPAEAKAIMHRATEDLRASGILARLPRPGNALPAFELPDTEGNPVRSEELLAQGPLVLTFYRGLW